VHQSGEALAGPPATEILDPVPHADLARAMRESLGSLLADLDDDTRNVVLTLARMWSTMVTGTIRSKDEAAAWAGAQLPDEEHRSVLSRARAIYLGEAVEQWDDLEGPVRPYAAQVV